MSHNTEYIEFLQSRITVLTADLAALDASLSRAAERTWEQYTIAGRSLVGISVKERHQLRNQVEKDLLQRKAALHRAQWQGSNTIPVRFV